MTIYCNIGMAAESAGENTLKIQIVHGPKKYHLTLEPPGDGVNQELCLCHLMEEVAKITEVPIKNQRLIVKGKSLTNSEATLKSCGIKDGSKVMLLGRKYNEQDESFIKQLSAIEATVNKIQHKLNAITEELDGIRKGFLASHLQQEALKKLEKRVATCNEEFSKQVENCDALLLGETADEIRHKRKRLVNRLLELQRKCDTLKEDIRNMAEQNQVT